VDDLAKGLSPPPARLEFYVREAGALMKREAELPATGSLAPLFYAFGLITAEELQAADPYANVLDTNFLSWLQETVHEAVRTAEQHELLKWRIRKYRDTLQEKFSLAAVQASALAGSQLASRAAPLPARPLPGGTTHPCTAHRHARAIRTDMRVSNKHPHARAACAGGRGVCGEPHGAGAAGGGADHAGVRPVSFVSGRASRMG
jgi:hypothetical protein